MVRDSRQITANPVRESWWQYETGGIAQYRTVVDGPYTAHYSYRSDLVKSDHFSPTSYFGEFRTCTPLYYDMTEAVPRVENTISGKRYYRRRERGFVRPYPNTDPGAFDTNPSQVPSWLARSARAKVLSSLKDSDVNVGTFLGELPESLKMMANTSIKVLQAYRAVRHGQFGKAAKALGISKKPKNLPGDAAGVWFAYKFGWAPLVSDVYNMHSAVMKQLNRPNLETRTRSVETDHLAYQLAAGEAVIPEKITKGVKVSVTYSLENETLAQLNALGLANPAAIAWELLPMSFVVDWFLPIGSFLDQLSAPLGLQFRHGYQTTYCFANFTLQDLSTTFVGTLPSWKVTGFGFNRSVLTNWPRPSFVVDLGLNRNQLATLAGLIAQRVR